MKHFKRLKIKCLLISLLFLKVSIVQAHNLSPVVAITQSTYQFCRSALVKFQKTPSLIESEQQLRGQGYDDRYVAGLDHAKENIQLVERLRADKINPFTSHIKEFANLLGTHIRFIEEGIKSQDASALDKEIRLNLLESLKFEAQERQNSERVTYRWWFSFNFRLSILATPKDYLEIYFKNISVEALITKTSMEEIDSFFRGLNRNTMIVWRPTQDLVNKFPERIIVPTIHRLGIISINSTHGTGVHFVGLNNDFVFADQITMYPDAFFLHDLNHIFAIKGVDSLRLATFVRQRMRTFSISQRKALEYVFYEITYEKGYTLGEYMQFLRLSPFIVPEKLGLSREAVVEAQTILTRILQRNPYVQL